MGQCIHGHFLGHSVVQRGGMVHSIDHNAARVGVMFRVAEPQHGGGYNVVVKNWSRVAERNSPFDRRELMGALFARDHHRCVWDEGIHKRRPTIDGDRAIVHHVRFRGTHDLGKTKEERGKEERGKKKEGKKKEERRKKKEERRKKKRRKEERRKEERRKEETGNNKQINADVRTNPKK